MNARLREMYREAQRRFWNITMTGLARGAHLTRYAMYQRLEATGPKLPIRRGRVLSISHSLHLAELMGIEPAQAVEANYPEATFTALPYGANEFDFVLSDQVLEHVQGDPFVGVEESRRVLKPGGIAVHTTVFAYPVHGAPGDFWRFTPSALRLLCREFSEVIECDGWGSFDAWLWAHRGMQHVPVPHAPWHPLHKVATRNDPAWPMVVWIVARK